MEITSQRRPIVFVTCGPSGAGKSTWINQHYIWDYDSLISRDAIRFNLLKPDDDYFAHESEVRKQFYSAIKEMTAEDSWARKVFIDATHLTPKSRDLVLRQIGETCKIIAVSFEVPLEVALERNAQRTGRANVPESAIRNMYNSYVVPTISEGFDEVWHINEKGECKNEQNLGHFRSTL